jgi:hypothetical protein
MFHDPRQKYTCPDENIRLESSVLYVVKHVGVFLCEYSTVNIHKGISLIFM